MEFAVGTLIGVLGLAVAIFTALRSKQLSHADFSLRIGEQSVRSRRLTKNPKHLIYLTSLGEDSRLRCCQLSYAIRNTSKKSLSEIAITLERKPN